MKLFRIEIEREIEGSDILHFEAEEKPADDKIISHINKSGYLFYPKYDKFYCYEVKKDG